MRVTDSGATRSTTVRFVDTNVLLYAISRDAEERGKAQRANAILDEGDVGLSVQVLQEFYVQATRSGRVDPLTHEQAVSLVESFLRFPTADLDTADHAGGLRNTRPVRDLRPDAAIIEAARALGCSVVLAEDLSDGQDYAGVRVENPFHETVNPCPIPTPAGTAARLRRLYEARSAARAA